MLGGATRRPRGRTTIHVAVVLDRVRTARRGSRVLGGRRGPGAGGSPDDAVASSRRRGPCHGARSRTGAARSSPVTRRTPTGSVPRLCRASHQPGHGVCLEPVWPGRSREGVRCGADRSRRGPGGEAFAKFGADRYDPRTSRCRCHTTSRRRPWRRSARQRGAVVMLDPQTGEVLALASTPTYDASADQRTRPGHGTPSRRPGRPGPTACCRGPRSAATCRLGVQDRDRGRGLGSGRSAGYDVQAATAAEKNGLLVDGYRQGRPPPETGSRRSTWSTRPRVVQHLLRADRARRPVAQLVDYAKKMGFGAPLPFDLPTAVRR